MSIAFPCPDMRGNEGHLYNVWNNRQAGFELIAAKPKQMGGNCFCAAAQPSQDPHAALHRPITLVITPSTNRSTRLIQFVFWVWHILGYSANASCVHGRGSIQGAGHLHLQWWVCFVTGRIVMLIPLDRRVRCLSCLEFVLVLLSLHRHALTSYQMFPDTPHSNACICLSFGHLNIPSSKWFSRILIFFPWHYCKAFRKGWRFL